MRAPTSTLLLVASLLGSPVSASAQEVPEAGSEAPAAQPTASTRDARAEQVALEPPTPRRLWIEADVGVTAMDMSAFAFAYGGWNTDLLPHVDDGVAFQGAMGGRWRWLTFGARAGTSMYSAYNVNTVGVEVGVQWPVRWVEPRMQLHGGYGWHGPTHLDLPDPGLAGPLFGGGVGLRMPLGDWFVLGLSCDADMMWLTGDVQLADEGPGVDPAKNATYRFLIATGQLADTWSGTGWQLRTTLTLGLVLW